MDARFLTERQLMEYLQVSRNTVRKLAAECGAACHIGRCLRYDRHVIDKHLEQKRKATTALVTSQEG